MTTKKTFHLLIAFLSFLSFFAPVELEGYTPSAAEHFLLNGTLTTVFYAIPTVFEPIGWLMREPGRIADPKDVVFTLLISGSAVVAILYNYAVLGLLMWNLFFLVVDSRGWRLLYRVGLLLSFAASLFSQISFFAHAGGLGFWLNPILLAAAIAGEFWIWVSEKKKPPRRRSRDLAEC
jgi:hypothetical protein